METTMKVSEVLQSGMVNDNTIICISKPLAVGYRTFKGFWYEDSIMEFAEDTVSKLSYIKAENKIYMEVE